MASRRIAALLLLLLRPAALVVGSCMIALAWLVWLRKYEVSCRHEFFWNECQLLAAGRACGQAAWAAVPIEEGP